VQDSGILSLLYLSSESTPTMDDDSSEQGWSSSTGSLSSYNDESSGSVSSYNDEDGTIESSRLINGLGLWDSWIYDSQLEAFQELINNAIAADGATDWKPKAIEITKDEYRSKITGIVFTNNSPTNISIASVLALYRSSRKRGNGIGLKRACATLSDLSFVLVRNNTEMAIGIIAKNLQDDHGIYFPSYSFRPLRKDLLKNQLKKLFKDEKVNKCIASYGNGNFNYAVERLVKQIHHLRNSPTWKRQKHTFCLILDKVLDDNETRSKDKNYEMTVEKMMEKLHEELPLKYIHLKNDVVTLQDEIKNFNCWPRRLTELAVFYQKINENNDFFSWETPSSEDYDIRLFIGFDSLRVNTADNKVSGETKALSLYLYSGQSGRLVLHEPDARNLLNLCNSDGSRYCHGLTIIVDDAQEKIPLNHGKNEVREVNDGLLLKKNMYTWVSTVAKGYYNFFEKKFNDKRSNWYKALEETLPKAKDMIDEEFNCETLALSEYDVYKNQPSEKGNARLVFSGKVDGRDTLLRFPTDSVETVEKVVEKVVNTKRKEKSIERTTKSEGKEVESGKQKGRTGGSAENSKESVEKVSSAKRKRNTRRQTSKTRAKEVESGKRKGRTGGSARRNRETVKRVKNDKKEVSKCYSPKRKRNAALKKKQSPTSVLDPKEKLKEKKLCPLTPSWLDLEEQEFDKQRFEGVKLKAKKLCSPTAVPVRSITLPSFKD